MPVDALQNVGDLMNDHIGHEGRNQFRVGAGNPVVEHFDVHALVGESIGQRAGMKRFWSARHKANHHRIPLPLAEADLAVPFQLYASRQETGLEAYRCRVRHSACLPSSIQTTSL